MRVTRRLFQSCRITLFTRANCSLCTQARSVLAGVWDKRPFEFAEVDVMKPDAKAWRELYDFDVPVIHISKAKTPAESPALASKTVKLMHRFSPDDVQAKMDMVDAS